MHLVHGVLGPLEVTHRKFALWLGLVGAVALYAAFSLGADELLPRLRELSA